MYLGVDVGGTKTLVASLTNAGVITEQQKFPTNPTYSLFLKELRESIESLAVKDFQAGGIAVPGLIDRTRGIGLACGNLPWKRIPVEADLEHIIKAPVVVDNDANLAALSEAMLLKHKYNVVLYATFGTGIGTGVIVNRQINPVYEDMEGGLMKLEFNNRLLPWQDFASGKAIFKRFGKRMAEIEDAHTLKLISRDIALGLQSLIAIVQPEVIVLGGGVATYYDKFKPYLKSELKKYETPLTKTPPIRKAQRPEEAVLYGCYDLAKERYGKSS